ncbi:MAG: type VI secretion system tube protein Hcp [Burkholderiales bacterium]|nr:type VI secretion system tube protein Hcp [Burkholderiales bacterium]
MDVLVLDLGDKIKGNSQLKGFANKIECLSFSQGVSLPLSHHISNTERTAGKPNFQDITLSKMTDQATPAMFQAVCEGTPITQAVITIGRNQGDGTVMEHMKYTLKEVLIANLSTSGGGGMPMDTFSLSFSNIQIEYVAQKSDSTKEGQSSAKWDLKTNSAT